MIHRTRGKENFSNGWKVVSLLKTSTDQSGLTEHIVETGMVEGSNQFCSL